ncbi:MarR family winged helix-turn-helix transcriptional regulator [Nocardia sp. NPDC057227]|uniref:MarR family winged helix-turn-helix transcriptional regulator n=1 Tax=Nocardia sp. NPDC057227 TaxID=3346056 RepID=UPI00363153D5
MDEPDYSVADAEHLRLAVGKFVRRVRSADTMPAGQAAVLGHLRRNGPSAIVALAERERVRHQTMARTVKLLTDQGLVHVGADPDDRRRVVVSLSAEGSARLDDEQASRAEWIARAAGVELTAQERAVLKRFPAVLEKLIAAGG